MEAQAILDTARAPGDPPDNWTVIPLDRRSVRMSILGWLGGMLLGMGLGALLFFAALPSISLFIWLVLGVLAFVGIGSHWLMAQKTRQLLDAARYIIVMTPDLYVQQTGGRLVAVPMGDITSITLRGVFGGLPHGGARDMAQPPSFGLMINQFFGGSQTHRTRRTPDSLAFVDNRDQSVVVVAEDKSFAELPVIEELLRNYVENALRARTH